MQQARGVADDGSLRRGTNFDTYMASEVEVHAGPEHVGHRCILFIHLVPLSKLNEIEPFEQISAATVIHHFSDIADNLLGDRALLQWAHHRPWLQYKGLDMWPTLCETLPYLRRKYYNDKANDPDNYVQPHLLERDGLMGRTGP